MKAKMYSAKTGVEIRLNDGKQFFQTDEESKQEFISRVELVVKEDYLEDLALQMVTVDALKKYDVAKLEEAAKGAKGIHKDLLLETIESKKVKASKAPKETHSITDESTAKTKTAKTVKTKKVAVELTEEEKAEIAKEKAEKVEAAAKAKAEKAEVAAKAKAEKDAAKEAAKAEREAAKEAKAKAAAEAKANKVPTEREAELEAFKASDEYVACKENVGKECTFITAKHKDEQPGIIKGLSVNKTLTKVYYTVLNTVTEKRECCVITNVTVK